MYVNELQQMTQHTHREYSAPFGGCHVPPYLGGIWSSSANSRNTLLTSEAFGMRTFLPANTEAGEGGGEGDWVRVGVSEGGGDWVRAGVRVKVRLKGEGYDCMQAPT